MSRWKWALLIFELALFAIILVLPQVALPDFAFHRGTGPVAAKANLAITLDLVGAPQQMLAPATSVVGQVESTVRAAVYDLDSRLSLFCTLIC
ncbi:MAG TPA: hypothetical protein VGF06_02120 [Terriglobales bacterium]|jgi:hypothetical protein